MSMPWVLLFIVGVFDYKKILSKNVNMIWVKTTANVRGYLVLVSVNDPKCEISRGILAVQGIRRHTYNGR